jgi:hypothetical protein
MAHVKLSFCSPSRCEGSGGIAPRIRNLSITWGEWSGSRSGCFIPEEGPHLESETIRLIRNLFLEVK